VEGGARDQRPGEAGGGVGAPGDERYAVVSMLLGPWVPGVLPLVFVIFNPFHAVNELRRLEPSFRTDMSAFQFDIVNKTTFPVD